MDICFHWLRDFEEKGFIKVNFKPSKQNTADIMTKNLSKKLYKIHQPNIVQDSGLIARIDTNRDKFFYDIDKDLDDDLYENSEPTNRKGGPTLSYHDFIYYDIGDRYFDIDDGDLYNFGILGHFAFKIISHVTINTKKPTLSFYRLNKVRNLSNLSKTEKTEDNFIEENF